MPRSEQVVESKVQLGSAWLPLAWQGEWERAGKRPRREDQGGPWPKSTGGGVKVQYDWPTAPGGGFLFCFLVGGGSPLLRQFFSSRGNGSCSSLRCVGFSLWWFLLWQSVGSRLTGFGSCGPQAQELWLMGCNAWG